MVTRADIVAEARSWLGVPWRHQGWRRETGCDKASATCQAKFANIANFRGFPFVPGLDATVQTPNAL